MTITNASFRAIFPEFADLLKFPDAQVSMWLAYAYSLLNAERFCDTLDMAAGFFVAHELVLYDRNRRGKPGGVLAPMSAKAVDKVSASYDTGAVTLENAGHWGGTSYGLQLLQLMRMFGAGPIQL